MGNIFFKKCPNCGVILDDARRSLCKKCREDWIETTIRKENSGEVRPRLTWEETIGAALSRDNYTCQKCGKHNSDKYDKDDENDKIITNRDRYVHVVVHHIIPFSIGGTHELENLMTLCEDCHRTAHPKGYKKTARHIRENIPLFERISD